MSDRKILNIYNSKAQEYANFTSNDTPNVDLATFIDRVPTGGRIFDFGCGPSHYAEPLAKAGFTSEASDAS